MKMQATATIRGALYPLNHMGLSLPQPVVVVEQLK